MSAVLAIAANEMLDWFTGVANPPAVATRYITTFLGNPQAGGVENISTITGSSNRIAMTAAMDAASGSQAVNGSDITFTVSAAGGAVVNYVAIYDAITGGNLYGSAQVIERTITTLDGLRIPAGSLTIQIA